MTKTVPEATHRRIAELDQTITSLCAHNISDYEAIKNAQDRTRDREVVIAQLQAEVEIIRMGVEAWSAAAGMVESLGSAVEITESEVEPSQPDSAKPPTVAGQILRLLAEANRPMKAKEVATILSDRYGENSVTGALSYLKRKRLITHLSESREWAIR